MSLVVPSLRGIVASPPWAKNELWRKALAAPTLDLRFADSKSLTDAVSGQNLITFTRASSGTYVGSDGLIKTALANVPRFDHNPVTGESLGLLIEEQRTNLLLRSEEFDNPSWIGSSFVTPNSVAAPNGSITADTLTTTGAAVALYNTAGVTVTAGATYTFSVYVKLGTMAAGAYKIAAYDVSNSAFIGADVVPAATPSSSSWTRVTYTFTTPAGCTSLRVYPFRSNATFPSSTVHLWGAQLEAGAFPTSYIPTTNAQVTRNADLASITGSNFSRWYRQDEGTVFTTSTFIGDNGLNQFLYSISDGALGDEIRLFKTVGTTSASYMVETSASGTTYAAFSDSLSAFGTEFSSAFAFAADNTNRAVSGSLGTTDTSVDIPTVNQMRIGARMNSTFFANSTISRLAFFDRRLPNATLQSITSP